MKITTAFALLTLTLACTSATYADTFGSGPDTFSIDFVTIGNPGNTADTTGDPNPAGSVGYGFRMGKFEISEDMIAKANILGGLDIFELWREPDSPNTAATGMSWNEAARFVNWLNTSQGHQPAYNFRYEPGDVGYSATANIGRWQTGDAGFDPNNLFRNSLAKYVLPSANEWYKAAYYDPMAEVYYDYPTGSNSPPVAVTSGTAVNTAVYDPGTRAADVTRAGGLSPYGTMGQGGNVYEQLETEFDLVNDVPSSERILRGGGWGQPLGELLSSSWEGLTPRSNIGIGFRVASVPEPGSLALLALGGLSLLVRRPVAGR